jgi:hypothetical protein
VILDILSDKKREPAECIIKIGTGEEEITDLYPFLTEVVVECSRIEASVATLKFESRRDENGRWIMQDDKRIVTWQWVMIEAAFGSTTEEVMRGYVREVNADYPQDPGAATVTVECQDESLKLDREHVCRVWGGDAPTSDQAIVTEIVSTRHGLMLHPDNAAGQSTLVLNQNKPDIRFLRDRAEANGYELIFSHGQVYFGPMRVDAEPQAVIMVYAGCDTHCINFSVNSDAHQPDKVTVDVPDAIGSGTTTVEIEPDLAGLGPDSADSSSSGLGDFVWRLPQAGGSNVDKLSARAQQRANEAAMKIKANGEMDGALYGHVLRVGEPVPVDGIGKRYAGTYYVDTVTHRFDVNGYRQTFTLLRNAYGDNIESAGNVLSSIL